MYEFAEQANNEGMSTSQAPRRGATPRPFPADFVFGAATAPAQNDGAADDVALMTELGLQAYRFSCSWARVCPDGGRPEPRGIDTYSRLCDELLNAGITPWLTLHRGELPAALATLGGWASRDTAHRFRDYALGLHEVLGDRVPVWLTLNEPWGPGGLDRTDGPNAGPAAAHHRLLAHGLAVQALRERDAALRLGLTLNLTVAAPADPGSAGDLDAARRVDAQFNRAALDPIFRGRYPEDFLEDAAGLALQAHLRPGDLAQIAQPIDMLGVNYYYAASVSERPGGPASPGAADPPLPAPGPPLTAIDWVVAPDGLRALLLRVESEYAGPARVALYVSENGAAADDTPAADGTEADGAVDDTERAALLRAHLGAVLDAVDAGVAVRGYFYCPLLDSPAWTSGHAGVSGLVHVDGSGRRTLKHSGSDYRRIIAAHTLVT